LRVETIGGALHGHSVVGPTLGVEDGALVPPDGSGQVAEPVMKDTRRHLVG